VGDDGLEVGIGLDLLAIQVLMPTATNLWLRPVDGLQVLYGRNGVGKTTVISAIGELLSPRHTLRSIAPHEPATPLRLSQARAFVKTRIPLVFLELVESLLEEFERSREKPQGIQRVSGPKVPRGWLFAHAWFSTTSSGIGQSEGSLRFAEDLDVVQFERWLRGVAIIG
jgi:hypothetical protein